MTANLENLEAWAISQGYDPTYDYSDTEVDDGDEPEAIPAPPSALPDGFLSTNFRAAEFACRHCGKLPPGGMDPKLIDALQGLRDSTGKPITINSGYRCEIHNKNVGGAKNSQHLLGTAADFTIAGMNPSAVYAMLDPTWPGGLGKYNTFTHADVRSGRARWSG